MWMLVFWVATPSGLVGRYQHFGGTLVYKPMHDAIFERIYLETRILARSCQSHFDGISR
jgi:hypothetical protein